MHHRVSPTLLEKRLTCRSVTMNNNQILIALCDSEMTKIGKEEFAQQSLPQKVFFCQLGGRIESQ